MTAGNESDLHVYAAFGDEKYVAPAEHARDEVSARLGMWRRRKGVTDDGIIPHTSYTLGPHEGITVQSADGNTVHATRIFTGEGDTVKTSTSYDFDGERLEYALSPGDSAPEDEMSHFDELSRILFDADNAERAMDQPSPISAND